MSEEVDRKGALLGLLNENGNPVPLKLVGLDIHIFCNTAEVTSNLTYYNEEDDPVEATFTFPVDDGSAVFQFEAEIRGRHIKAEIQEKEQAVLTYQDAVEHGKTAMLLKEDSSAGDIFSCMLGNLPPKSEATLTMKYVIELPQEPDGKLRFTVPTVLNPRYSPDAGGTVAAEGATYTPPCKVPYDFKMAAVIEGYFRVSSVTSDKDNLSIAFENGNKIVKVSLAEQFKFDHDLQFLVEYEEPFTPQVVLEGGSPQGAGLLKEDVLMMSFYPHLEEVTMATTGEYVFVIDRSGSMGGAKIKDAREALLLFVKSLPPECYFNIISFGSSFKSLFSSRSKQYGDDSLKIALELIETMDADMGGTEILAPLKDVFKQKPISGHARSVFILTDGEVSNTEEVLGLVREQCQRSSTRVFSLGIGEGVSTSLVKGIARNGKGKAEFISGGQRVQSKVVSLLKCAMQPAITDLTLSWDLPPNVTPVCIPTELPSIITAGERLTLFAVLQGVDKNTIYAPSTVTLKGQHIDSSVQYLMTFTLCEADEIRSSAPIHRLATKVQIKLLQDQETARFGGGDDDYDYMKVNTVTEVQSLRQKIIDLSCHGNIISKYTAFVAIDTEGQKVEGRSVQRSCPVPTLSPHFVQAYNDRNLKCSLMDCGLDSYDACSGPVLMSYGLRFAKTKKKKGGGLFCGPSLGKMFKRSKRKSSAPGANTMAYTVECVDSPPTPEVEICSSGFDAVDTDEADKETEEKSTGEDVVDSGEKKLEKDSKPGDDVMMSVISLQQIKGQWDFSAKLLHLLHITQEDFDKLDFSDDKTVVITLVVLCWLKKNFSHRHEEWQMIEAKAKAWLSSSCRNQKVEELLRKTTETVSWK